MTAVTATVPLLSDDFASAFVYSGSWQTPTTGLATPDASLSSYVDSTYHSTTAVGASATFRFSGNLLQLRGGSGPSFGAYSVSIDGGAASTRYANAPAGNFSNVILFDSGGLGSNGEHVVVLTNLGANGNDTLGSELLLDYALTYPVVGAEGASLTNTTVDDTSTRLIYTGAWDSNNDTRFIGGSSTYTNVDRASVSLTFNGSAVYVFGDTVNDHGNFSTTLDGTTITADAYTPDLKIGTLVFFAGGLDSSLHTLTITNKAGSGATGNYFDLDAIIYTTPSKYFETAAGSTSMGSTSSTSASATASAPVQTSAGIKPSKLGKPRVLRINPADWGHPRAMQDHRERIARLCQLLAADSKAGANGGAAGGRGASGPDHGGREEVKLLSLGGIPDSPPFLRPAAYRKLLNLGTSAQLLSQYSAFVEEVALRLRALPAPTHELGAKELKQDRLLREIERDVNRTFGGLAWFGAPSSDGAAVDQEDAFWHRLKLLEEHDNSSAAKHAAAAVSLQTEATVAPPLLSLLPPEETGEQEGTVVMPITPTSPVLPSIFGNKGPSAQPRTRRQALLRPLYLYATLNPGLGYVQGMNSIVAVFIWVFSAHGSALEAEASAFFALGAILAQMRDLFVASLDGTVSPSPSSPRLSAVGSPGHVTPTGLGATLSRYSSLLNWLDPTIAASLDSKGIDPALYVFRWLTTLFASDFSLPDLVRIWDRVIALYPDDTTAEEALSPVLGHLLDLSLAIVLMERPVIISPYSTFQRTIAVLHDPQIEGEAVDALLTAAWAIRDRRLGRAKRASAEPGNWRAAASKWTSAAKEAAVAASTSSTATSLKSRFWSTPPKHGRTLSITSSIYASDCDLDDAVSVAESEGSVAGSSPLFASRGQRIGLGGSNGNRLSFIGEATVVEGKVLPPPPDEIDERERTLASLPRPPSTDGDEADESEDDYGDPEPGPSLRDRAASSWGGWKTSLSKLAASDAAASLSKATTNLSIAASLSAQSTAHSFSQSTARLGSSDAAASLSKTTTNLSIQAALLREQVAEQGPERLARIKENVAVVSGRLLASTGSEGPGGPRRPGSPVQEPFTPPKWGDSPGTSRRPVSPAPFTTPDAFYNTSPTSSVDMSRAGGSNGPRPLLLSTSARRAINIGQESILSPSPPSSRRNSLRSLSPSQSPSSTFSDRGPTLYSTAPVAPLGIVRSHSRGASNAPPALHRTMPASTFHLRSASIVFSGGLETSDDVPIQSLRLQDDPNGQNKLRRSVQRRETGLETESRAVPAASGRGWTLSDAPVRKAAPLVLDTSFQKDMGSGRGNPLVFSSPNNSDAEGSGKRTQPSVFASPAHTDDEGALSARESVQPDSAFAETATNLPWSPVSSSALSEMEELASASGDSGSLQMPGFPRTSSTSTVRPPRTSSVVNATKDSPLTSPLTPELPTSPIRRTAALGRKRLGRSVGSQGSVSSMSELDADRRKSVSVFLAGEGGGDDGRSSNGSSTGRKRDSKQKTRSETVPAAKAPPSEWDVAADILDAYGE